MYSIPLTLVNKNLDAAKRRPKEFGTANERQIAADLNGETDGRTPPAALHAGGSPVLRNRRNEEWPCHALTGLKFWGKTRSQGVALG